MKKHIYISILLYFIILNFSVAQPVIDWQRTFGGSDYDAGVGISETSDGGSICIGSTRSIDGDVTGFHGGNSDMWIVKLEENGNLQWQKCYGGSLGDDGNYIQQVSDGYIACGSSESNNGDVSGNHGYYDFWIVKIDTAGNLQWQKSYGGSGGESAIVIKQTPDGGYITAGTTYSNDGNVIGQHGNRDYWVVKMDASGNLQWQKCLGGSQDDFGYGLDLTFDGGYVIAGSTQSVDGDVSNNNGTNDYWVVKLNSSGNIVWDKNYGGTMLDGAYSIVQTPDSGFIMNGETSSTDGDVTGLIGVYDYWIVKIDKNGILQWQKCLGGLSTDMGWAIQPTSDGGYIASGRTYSSDSLVTGFHGNVDTWIVKLDSAGNLLWKKSIGGTGEEIPYITIQTSDGSYMIAGSTSSNNGDVSNYHGGLYDMWIVKLTEKFNSVTGKLFADLNNNQAQDTLEMPLQNKIVREINTNRIAFSGPDGSYNLSVLDSGNYTVMPDSVNHYNPFPNTRNIYFSSILQTDSLNDFAFQPAGAFNDLSITISAIAPFRAGHNAYYEINYTNVGTTTLNPTVVFFPDTSLTFVSAIPSAGSITPDSVVWNFGPLAPFQVGNIQVMVNVNAGTPIGTLIYGNVSIEPIAGDADTVNNRDSWKLFTIGSYDPNEIAVDRNSLLTTEVSSPPYLNYIINFQNIGNDTAFNVKVQNNIPQELDINSFEFAASSRPVSINYNSYSRLMEFNFNNILLPDSNINEQGSHGFVRYRIKPMPTLVLNDSIKNSAAIYFDYNAPVMTDSAITVVVFPAIINEFDSQGQIKIYPNPASHTFTILFNTGLKMKNGGVKIFDTTGRLAYEQTISIQKSTIINCIFSPGVYFVKVDVGEKVCLQKLVITADQ
jgi:uncharacterized repeat protein (TIGR01451 family)